MLHLHRDDWTSEALDAAEREFRKREVNPTRLVELRANTEATRRHEEVAASQPLSLPLKLLFFLINPSTFCGLFVLIPVAEIAFNNRGYKTKYRQAWKCMGFGFLLYMLTFLALGLLSRLLG